jgi:cell division protein FtsX
VPITSSVNATTTIGNATVGGTVAPSVDVVAGTAGVSANGSGNATASVPAAVNATVPGGTGAIVNATKDAATKVNETVAKAADIVNKTTTAANTTASNVANVVHGITGAQKSGN